MPIKKELNQLAMCSRAIEGCNKEIEQCNDKIKECDKEIECLEKKFVDGESFQTDEERNKVHKSATFWHGKVVRLSRVESLDYLIQRVERKKNECEKRKALSETSILPYIELLNRLPAAEIEPFLLGYASYASDWLYQDCKYFITGTYSVEQAKLLLLEFADKERVKFERLKSRFSSEQSDNVKFDRTRIPESVRIEVWRRDQGKCASCGSRERLEYDHIVPVIRGGSNTARNVELLCETCNRTKGDRIQ